MGRASAVVQKCLSVYFALTNDPWCNLFISLLSHRSSKEIRHPRQSYSISNLQDINLVTLLRALPVQCRAEVPGHVNRGWTTEWWDWGVWNIPQMNGNVSRTLNIGSRWIWRCKMLSFEAILRQSTVSKQYDYYKNQFYCVICWRNFVMFWGKGVGATPFNQDPSMGGFKFYWFKRISCLYYFLESEFKVTAQAPSLRDFPSAPTNGSLVTPE